MSQYTKVSIKYLDWLSSRGEKREYNEGAIYAGISSECPFLSLREKGKAKKYCVIREVG